MRARKVGHRGKGYFSLENVRPGEEVRIPYTAETIGEIGMNVPRRRSFYKQKYGILSTVRVDGNEYVVTVTHNPKFKAPKVQTAMYQPQPPTIATAPRDMLDTLDPLSRHLSLFYRDAFIAALAMNEPPRAHELAIEAERIYGASVMRVVAKEN